MQLFTDEEYEEMDDDERQEWEYRQRIEDERERLQNIEKAKKYRGTDMGELLRQKQEERYAKFMAQQAAKQNEVIKVSDLPQDTKPPITESKGVGANVEVVEAAEDVIVDQPIVDEAPPSTKTDLEAMLGELDEDDEDDQVKIDDETSLIEDFTEFTPSAFIKFNTKVFRSVRYSLLSPAGMKVLLILSTMTHPSGRVCIELKDVPKFVKRFNQDPKTIRKAFSELLGYAIEVGEGEDAQRINVLQIDEVQGRQYLRIPREVGIGTFNGKGKSYAHKYYVKWNREKLEGLLLKYGGSQLATLLFIGIHANNKGIALPTIEQLSNYQGKSEEIIHKNLNSLIKARLIQRTHRKNKDNPNIHNEYYLEKSTGISFC